MKNKVIILSVIAAVLLTAVIVFVFITSRKEVQFTLRDGNYIVNITTEKGKTVKEISESQKVTLAKGKYLYSVRGELYKATSTQFEVKEDSEITVRPEFNEEHLKEVAENNRDAITAALRTKYPAAGMITLQDITLSKNGEWAYGTLRVAGSSDLYRYIMKLSDEKWSVAVTPSTALSIEANPSVPSDILYDLYK